MYLIWHGTASIEIGHDGGRLLFDPFVPLSGSPVPVTVEEFDGFTDILVTHGHLDHIADIPQIVRRNPDTLVHCTETPYRTLAGKGVPEKNLSLLRYGDERELRGFRIGVYHGKHAVLPKASVRRLAYALRSPARRNLPHILRENRVCAENDETVFYHIQADGKRVALMGSLNLRDDAEYPTGADLLVLPYNGWEDNYEPAVRVIERLKPKRVVLDHYDDTFPPLTMPLDLGAILAAYPGKAEALRLGEKTEV